MSYIVKKENLLSIIDPFIVNLLDIEPIISRQEIQQALSKGEVITSSQLNERENAIRKIAFLVCNEEYQYINLDKNIKNNYCENPHELIASLYFKKGDIVLTNIDEELKNILISEESSLIREKYIEENLNFNMFDNLQQDTWSNPEFVLSEINKLGASSSISQHLSFLSKDKIKTIFEKMSVDLLNDNEFLQKALSIEAFAKNYPPIYLLSDNFFDYILNDDELSVSMAHRFNNKHTIEHEMSTEKEKSKISSFLAEKIANTVLLDKKKVIKLLQKKGSESRHSVYDFYYSLSNKLKEDNDVIYSFLENTDITHYNNIEYYLPKVFFKDEKNLITYFEKYITKKFDIKNYPHIYEDWINDPEKIIKYSKIAPIVYDRKGESIPEQQGFVNILSVLPVKFRKNAEIMEVFVARKPKLYPQLSEVMRENKNLVLNYIKNIGKEINVDKISLKAYLSMSTKEKAELLTYAPRFSLREDFPTEDLKNIEIINALFSLKKHFKFEESYFEEYLYAQKDNIVKLINNDKENYHLLPLRKKLEHDIAFGYLETEKNQSGYNQIYRETFKRLPKELLYSKTFCIKALQKYKDVFCYSIPKNLFSDKEFLFTYLKMIDSREINQNAVKELPEKVISLIEFYQIKEGNYYSSISSVINKQMLSEKLNLNEKPKSMTKKKI